MLTSIFQCPLIGTVVIPNDVVQLTGLSAEFSVGTIIGLGSAVAQFTGVAMTSSVGSLILRSTLWV